MTSQLKQISVIQYDMRPSANQNMEIITMIKKTKQLWANKLRVCDTQWLFWFSFLSVVFKTFNTRWHAFGFILWLIRCVKRKKFSYRWPRWKNDTETQQSWRPTTVFLWKISTYLHSISIQMLRSCKSPLIGWNNVAWKKNVVVVRQNLVKNMILLFCSPLKNAFIIRRN